MNINHPRIQRFITDHFADYTPEKYKITILSENNGMISLSYINTKYNFSNICYIAV